MKDRPARPRDVICLGTDWYSASIVSVRHIVEELHDRGSRVLWVNPVPIRFPNARGKDFWNKVQTKARTHSRLLSRKGDRLWVYSPLYLPIYRGPGFLLNRIVISAQILALRLILGMWRPLVVGSAFTVWFALPAIRGLPMVFHFADKISSFREVASIPERRRVLERMEAAIAAAATVATCSSRSIHEHVLGLTGDDRKARYLPHALKTSAFLGAQAPVPPADLAALPRPVAGYFGSLTQTNDKDVFLAAARSLPGWSFVFIGRVAGDYGELQALPNVHFLGPRPHAEIPAYGAGFDISFMGWRAHEWISNCFPLKTLEYLALGKPIVCSSRIDELSERFPGYVRIAEGAEAFTEALVAELAADSADKAEQRRRLVEHESWSSRVDQILGWLDEAKGRAVA